MAKDKVKFEFDLTELSELMKVAERDFAKREKALVNPMRRALNPLREQMNDNAPVEHGILNKSHRTSRLKGYLRAGTVTMRTGPSSGMGKLEGIRQKLAGWRAHFSEFGTKNHKGTGYLDAAITQHWPTLANRLTDELAVEFKKRLRAFNRRK